MQSKRKLRSESFEAKASTIEEDMLSRQTTDTSVEVVQAPASWTGQQAPEIDCVEKNKGSSVQLRASLAVKRD